MNGTAVTVNGHALILCPERAAFDPATGSLLIADAHFGKAATFRAHGIPVPEGTTQETLARLTSLIQQYTPKRIVFLGDLLHAKPAQSPAVVTALQRWRDLHSSLECVLVRGNHDLHAGPPPAALGIVEVEEPWSLGAWQLCHHPQSLADGYVLAGHEHPVYVLRSRGESLRLPCFRFGPDYGVLPAFGDFTGGHPVAPARQPLTLYAIADRQIFKIDYNRRFAAPARDA